MVKRRSDYDSPWKEIKELEETEQMKYVTTIERRAIQQGIEQGSLQTAYEAGLEILTLRFQEIPQGLLDSLRRLSDLKRLKELHRQAIIAGSREEFEHSVETNGQTI